MADVCHTVTCRRPGRCSTSMFRTAFSIAMTSSPVMTKPCSLKESRVSSSRRSRCAASWLAAGWRFSENRTTLVARPHFRCRRFSCRCATRSQHGRASMRTRSRWHWSTIPARRANWLAPGRTPIQHRRGHLAAVVLSHEVSPVRPANRATLGRAAPADRHSRDHSRAAIGVSDDRRIEECLRAPHSRRGHAARFQ